MLKVLTPQKRQLPRDAIAASSSDDDFDGVRESGLKGTGRTAVEYP
jgi:hypothetical protein